MLYAVVLISLFALALLRLYSILPRNTRARHNAKSFSRASRTLGVFLGSGGHTSEALTLVSALDLQRYAPRIYFISEGDHLSAGKAKALEDDRASPQDQYTFFTVPRAREVHQSLFTTPPTALRSLLSCIYFLTIKPLVSTASSPDVLILNGPGTCLILCIAVYINRFFGLSSPSIIYVESFARVKSLSLSGKLLRPFVDRFIVQWPDLTKPSKRVEYRGWLV